jgi:toluene monooxygenase electron transfer component
VHVTLVSPKRDSCGSFDCGPSERLLYAGLRAGLPLPHECGSGTCGSCKARLLSGEVELLWEGSPARRFLKEGGGEILLCQTAARTDCEIGVRMRKDLASGAYDTPFYTHGEVSRSGMLTHDVLIMELLLEQPMNFCSGQFVLLRAEDLQGFRAYSMVNVAAGKVLELIVKCKADGEMSRRLFGQDIHGLRFEVFGPVGRATFDPIEAQSSDLVCAAGGTGIAGLMSVLERASRTGYLESHRAIVCFGVRSSADLFFVDRFAALKRRHPENVSVVVAVSDEDPPAWAAEFPGLRFSRGLVHEVLEKEEVARLASPVAYAAGPPAAVAALMSVLLTRHGVAPTRIRFDSFG